MNELHYDEVKQKLLKKEPLFTINQKEEESEDYVRRNTKSDDQM
jgi:hypothetical protein